MDDESNAGVETTDLEGSDEDTDEGVEADESLSSGDSEDDTDWKAEFEQAAKERDNYKTALDQKRQLRKKVPTQEIEEGSDEETRPATVADIRKIVTEQTATVSADTILSGMVKDDSKRKLVKLYYETRIRQTGTSDEAIKADLQAALDLADAKRLRKTVSEVARVNGQDKPIPMNGSGSDRGDGKKDHKFSADQVKDLTARAQRIGVDPKKFIAEAWKNQNG